MVSIQKIADKYGLKIIYDAAHAFGVKINNDSIFNFGDLSVLSFHATKVFNTIEGGAIVCHEEKMKNQIDYLKNFGFADEVTVIGPGINAKMNELQSAYGLLQLKTIDEDIKKRKVIAQKYRELFQNVSGICCSRDIEGVKHNYSYFPILIDQTKYGISRDQLYEKLKNYNIFGRRYFYPLISNFPTYKDLDSSQPCNLPIATKVANKVLCLPIFSELKIEIVEQIADIILKNE